MSTNISDLRLKLADLYSSGKSMFEISQTLNCSIHKVVYWMDKYGIKRRSRSEATYVKLNPNGDPFSIKSSLTAEELYLKGLALGLYWGEGDKLSRNGVRVTNTDPYVLTTFVKFLREICKLEERKLFYSIICFNDSNPEEAKEYWAKILGINTDKFGKIVQIPPQGKGTYKRKSQFGVCTVNVSNPKLKRWILDEINTLKELP